MAKLPNGGFDANEVEPRSPIEADPEFRGWHLMHAIESETKIAASGKGEYAQYTMEVLEGKYKGRRLWARFNLAHENPTAQQIAWANYSSLCRAVNVLKPTDTEDLHLIPFYGNVKYVPEEGKYAANNELIEGAYKPKSEGPGAAPPPKAQSTTSQPAWAKRAG